MTGSRHRSAAEQGYLPCDVPRRAKEGRRDVGGRRACAVELAHPTLQTWGVRRAAEEIGVIIVNGLQIRLVRGEEVEGDGGPRPGPTLQDLHPAGNLAGVPGTT